MPGSRVVIIGAGPAGLAAAACLRERGLAPLLLDRNGEPGGAYARMYSGTRLASPTEFNGLPGLAQEIPAEYASAADYADYLRRYARHFQLEVRRADVVRVERGFVVHTGSQAIPADAVVVATGMWDFPRRLPLGGTLRVVHASEWQGPAGLRSLLVVGGATSGVEIATEAAEAGVRVTVSTRRPLRLFPQRVLGKDLHHLAVVLERLPVALARADCEHTPTLRGTDLGFTRLRRAGRIELRPAVAGVEGGCVRFVDGSELSPDAVVAATGYRFETPFLPAEVARAAAGHLRTRRLESVSWPGLYSIGSPCAAGLDSRFLRGIARDAPLLAARVAGGEG